MEFIHKFRKKLSFAALSLPIAWRIFNCTIFIIVTLTAFEIYLHRTLKGDINYHILAGGWFGVPDALQKKGVEPLFPGPKGIGWDGQFYYYISNDLLGLLDTAKHIDAPSYRYQRVGLPLYAATVAALTGHDWVSPQLFFVSYFLLVLTATWFGALLFSRAGIPPMLILLWSLSVGTQITLFNALPDAAADSFLLLAFVPIFAGQYGLAVIPITLAVLSREVYVLFPFSIMLTHIWDRALTPWKAGTSWSAIAVTFLRWYPWYWLVVPIVVAIAWQVYLFVHFGFSASSQAHGILGAPLFAWLKYFFRSMLGTHRLAPGLYLGMFEAMSLLFSMAMLVTGALAAWGVLCQRNSWATVQIRGVAAATLALAGLYVCFGKTVTMHYSGYVKATAVFTILIPLLISERIISRTFYLRAIALLCIAIAVTSYYNLKVRILPKSSNLTSSIMNYTPSH